MPQLPLNFDAPLAIGLALADKSAEAQAPDFHAAVREVLKGMQGEFATEQLRAACKAQGIEPKSHKCWGGVTNQLRAEGLIEFVGTRRAKERGTHGKHVAIYRKVMA